MRFRLHSMVAALITVLLLSALVVAQQPATSPGSGASAGDQQQTTPPAESSDQQPTPEAPIEPVMSGPYPVMSKAAEDRGRQIFEMFNHQQAGQIYPLLVPGLKARIKAEAKYVDYNKKLSEKMGAETKMIQENIVPYYFAPDTIYSRVSNFAHVSVPVMTTIIINQRGQIDAMTIGPMPTVAEGRFAGYHDANKLKLPFNDEWLVYQGGRTAYENKYAVSDDQRFALDFVYLKNGRLFSGAGGVGANVSDYYCFGQPILAPADGKIVKAEGGYDDNPPGKPSGDPADGNVVAIAMGSGENTETAVMNHLKQNSLKVKIGDEVKQGQVLAECGNSGAGPIPHLHFQLQKGLGTVIPAQFVDYTADGKPVASGEPKRGEMVKNAPSPAGSAMTNPVAPMTPPTPAAPAPSSQH